MTVKRARAIETLFAVLFLWSATRISIAALGGPAVLPGANGQRTTGGRNQPGVLIATSPRRDIKTVWSGPGALKAPVRPPSALRLPMPAPAILIDPAQKVPRALPPAPLPSNIHPNRTALLPGVLAPHTATTSRITGSFWMLARRSAEMAGSAPNGQLGGSQIGARLLAPLPHQLPHTVRLSLRTSAALHTYNGRELAPGVSWQPVARLPIEIVAERRIRLSGQERDAFALLAAGGVSDVEVAPKVQIDVYAQTGIVGLSRRLKFADGAVTARTEIAPRLQLGIGLWGGAQPGLSRLDTGPALRFRLPIASISADWRFRVAGNARPGSGPSITIAKDF